MSWMSKKFNVDQWRSFADELVRRELVEADAFRELDGGGSVDGFVDAFHRTRLSKDTSRYYRSEQAAKANVREYRKAAMMAGNLPVVNAWIDTWLLHPTPDPNPMIGTRIELKQRDVDDNRIETYDDEEQEATIKYAGTIVGIEPRHPGDIEGRVRYRRPGGIRVRLDELLGTGRYTGLGKLLVPHGVGQVVTLWLNWRVDHGETSAPKRPWMYHDADSKVLLRSARFMLAVYDSRPASPSYSPTSPSYDPTSPSYSPTATSSNRRAAPIARPPSKLRPTDPDYTPSGEGDGKYLIWDAVAYYEPIARRGMIHEAYGQAAGRDREKNVANIISAYNPTGSKHAR